MNQRKFSSILVTGGSGFIGTNFIRFLFSDESGFKGSVINFDALTYAGNPANLSDLQEALPERYHFVRGDIRDREALDEVFRSFSIDAVVHFAAESHVDRSIYGPEDFVTTNINGTFTLLECLRTAFEDRTDMLLHHVSTDEVFGSLGETGLFTEDTPYDPRSPYSASKAASDHLVRTYHHTYGLPVTLSNCSNNYGPYQFPEKLIPLMLLNMLDGKALPVYGDGKNVRDWLFVRDHARAIWLIMQNGEIGRSYNVGGDTEVRNIDLVNTLCDITATQTGVDSKRYRDLIQFVPDRPGHDRRYAIDCSRIKSELGWRQTASFSEGLEETVNWYLDNHEWIQDVRTGAYRQWIETNYADRN